MRVYEMKSTLHSLARSDEFNAAMVEHASKALGESIATLAKLRTEQEQKIYSLLTPEQRDKLQQQKDKHGPAGMRPRHFESAHCDGQGVKWSPFPQLGKKNK